MKLSHNILKQRKYDQHENGEYTRFSMKLWWTEEGYQIDGTRIIITTTDELEEHEILIREFKFGKYSGVPVRDIEDFGYLKWAYENMNMGGLLMNAVKLKMNNIQFYGR